ncbi:MAG: DUF3626 domain-containing protein [Longimicrobiaceae bacterium]
MIIHAPAQTEPTRKLAAARRAGARQATGAPALAAGHPQAVAQRELAEAMNNGPHARRLQALAATINPGPRAVAGGERRASLSGGAVQRKPIGDIPDIDEERARSIVAAWVALQRRADVDESLPASTVLGNLGLAEGWRAVDIPDKVFGVIADFLARSPAFYVPTTTAIWKSFLERIVRSRGRLVPPEGIDLSSPDRDMEVEAERRATLDRVGKKLEETPPPGRNQHRARALADRIWAGHITINFSLDKLFSYRAPRILNAFEVQALTGSATNNISGRLEEERRKAEKHHFGIDDRIAVKPRIRPRYAALNYKDHPTGAAARNDYGLSYMVLSNAIRPACTITIGDTFDVIGTELDGAFPFTQEGVLRLAQAAVASDSAGELGSSAGYTAGDIYLDVQIHDDVDIRRNVERIYVSTLEMQVFGIDLATVDELIGKLTGGVFVREV